MSILSLRERNNKARREHYDREKEKEEWRMFEDVVVREHYRIYGHEIWHTSMIPSVSSTKPAFLTTTTKSGLTEFGVAVI